MYFIILEQKIIKQTEKERDKVLRLTLAGFVTKAKEIRNKNITKSTIEIEISDDEEKGTPAEPAEPDLQIVIEPIQS